MPTHAYFPRARIPYKAWGSSYFPAWQTSPLAEVNIGPFAAEAMAYIFGKRNVPIRSLEYLISGSTVPWHWKFWNSPTLASCANHRIPGYHIEQACATGLQTIVAAASEIQSHAHDVVGVLAFDRTSDSPVGVFPERRAYQRTIALSDVWDNFGFDPATSQAMLNTAGNAARKHKLDRAEIDELTVFRYQQYFQALESGLLADTLIPLQILNLQGQVVGEINSDLGVRKLSLDRLAAMRELDTCVTSGTQTHAADGMATLMLCTPERLPDFSPKPEIHIQLLGKLEIRTGPSLMPEAPALATRKLLTMLEHPIQDVAVIKTHNPFAVNDAIFAKVLEVDWHKMNQTGCSLVWGHPQGPTLVRLTIEALEETVQRGGGYTLVCGCAAGDVGIAALFHVA